MSNHENLDTVKRLYSAFGTGDWPSLQATLDAGINWTVPGSAPWAGEGRGHEHVRGFFQKFGSSASLETFEPRSFLADGDTVVVLGYEEGTFRQTGRQWKAHFTHTFEVSGGKITAHREYIDTQAIAEALRA
jgi:ketosteroid isomerase-like protein